MSAPRPHLRPDPQSRGLASANAADLQDMFAGAWNAMIDLAARVPAGQPSRLEGWSAHEVLVHLGSWDEHRTFASLLDDARHGRVHEPDDADARNALVIAAHHDATGDDIDHALRTARDRGLEFLTSGELATIGPDWTDSALGQLPVAGVVMASTFELAVHALDLTEPGQVPAALLDAGVAALVDLVGALAARRGLEITVAVVTPIGSWATGCLPGAWMTIPLQGSTRARNLGWPAVEGTAPDILDAAAGRQLAAQLLVTRRLRLYDVPALLRLTGALEEVAGIPGGSALRTAARTLDQSARLIGRLGGAVRSRL